MGREGGGGGRRRAAVFRGRRQHPAVRGARAGGAVRWPGPRGGSERLLLRASVCLVGVSVWVPAAVPLRVCAAWGGQIFL